MEFVPRNEQGVVWLFAVLCESAGWRLVDIGESFPDALLERDGEQWRVEFEFRSSNFLEHGHDHRRCDLIVCWVDDYKECPLPVIALSENDWLSTKLQKSNPKDIEIEFWKCRVRKLDKILKRHGIKNDEHVSSEVEETAKIQCAIDQDLAIQDYGAQGWSTHRIANIVFGVTGGRAYGDAREQINKILGREI